MDIYAHPKGIIFISHPQKRQEQDELQRVIDRVREWIECDVIIDCSAVDSASGAMFSQLLELRQLLHENGYQLVLCGVAPVIKGVFASVRLDDVFDFVKDKFAALAYFQTMV